MNIDLKYFVEKDIQEVDLYSGQPRGCPYDIHTMIAVIDEQIFRQKFAILSLTKTQGYKIEALLFAQKLQELGKAIENQVILGEKTTVTHNGITYNTF